MPHRKGAFIVTEASDVRFWDRAARKYAKSKVADPGGYERTLERSRALLKPGDRVLGLGCATGTTALRIAAAVQSYLATDISPEMIAIDKVHNHSGERDCGFGIFGCGVGY